MPSTRPSSARKGRSVSPPTASAKKKVASPKSATNKKNASSKKATPASSKLQNKTPRSKSMSENENVEGSISISKKEYDDLLWAAQVDSSALHNVLRVQYLQCYAMAFLCIASAFSSAVKPLPMFTGTSPLAQAVAGCLGLAQAFSLTAAAQSTYIGMKKTLQYNMFFHLLFAFVTIVLQDPKLEVNVQAVVCISCLNVGLNMWACYFKEPATEVFVDEEEDDTQTVE